MILVDSSGSDSPAIESRRLGPGARLLYGVGEVANSVKLVLFGLFLLYFYTTVMGLPGSLVGLAAGVGLIWDALIDPVIGRASDRARSRLGRRHVFMLFGTATMGLSLWALFSPPRGLPTELLFGWFVLASLLVRLATSAFMVPYYALGAELSQDYDDRTSLTAVRGACGLLGALVVSGLSFIVFFPNIVSGEEPRLNYDGYPAMGLVFGLVMTVTGLVASVATLRWRSSQSAGESGRPSPPVSLLTAAASALRNGSFRVLLLSFTLVYLGITISNTLALHALTYYVAIVDSGELSAIQVVQYAGALVGVPLWLWLARRLEKRPLYIAACLATALLMLGAFLLVGDGRLFGTGNVRPLLIGYVLSGLATSLFWVLPASMLADVADEDALISGSQRHGTLFGLFSFGQQLATGLAVVVAGVVVDRFAGLEPGRAQQSSLTVERIGMLFSLLPAALLVLAALLILSYRLDRRRVGSIQRRLAQASGWS